VVAVGVKLPGSVGDADAKHLHWLGVQIGDHPIDKVLFYADTRAYRCPQWRGDHPPAPAVSYRSDASPLVRRGNVSDKG
jgi:hypothetical protein